MDKTFILRELTPEEKFMLIERDYTNPLFYSLMESIYRHVLAVSFKMSYIPHLGQLVIIFQTPSKSYYVVDEQTFLSLIKVFYG